MMRTTIVDIEQPRGPLIRWGAVFAGAVWGLAVMAVLSSLWLALAYPTGIDVIRDNLQWFIAGSGALALFIAGVVAGALTDNRGAGSGWLHGMTAWGTLLIATIVFGLPSVFGLFSAGELRTIESGDLVGAGANDAMWATFATLVIGAVLAAFGGMIGGAPRRSVGTSGAHAAGATAAATDSATDLDERSRMSADDRMSATPARTTADTIDDDDRVMVRRTADGTYVDQEGHRYVEEPAGAPARRDTDT